MRLTFKRESLPQSSISFLQSPDTETLYIVVTQNILDKYAPGKLYTWDVKVTLMGLQKEAVSKKVVEIYDLPLTWEEYAELAQEQVENLMRNCHLMPGNYKNLKNFTNFVLFFFSFSFLRLETRFRCLFFATDYDGR